jgi:hypothetical protein
MEIQGSTKILYHNKIYPSTHFAVNIPDPSDDSFICILKYNHYQFLIQLNTTDARGYRSIIRLIDRADINSTFNRVYTFGELNAIMHVASAFVCALQDLGLIVQIELAGNNSQTLVENNIVLGNDNEPSMLHLHIICRGNPDYEYITGVKLRGPIIGALFNMRGKSIPGLTTQEWLSRSGNGLDIGNNTKKKWLDGEMKLVSNKFASLLESFLVKKCHDISIICIRNYS